MLAKTRTKFWGRFIKYFTLLFGLHLVFKKNFRFHKGLSLGTLLSMQFLWTLCKYFCFDDFSGKIEHDNILDEDGISVLRIYTI